MRRASLFCQSSSFSSVWRFGDVLIIKAVAWQRALPSFADSSAELLLPVGDGSLAWYAEAAYTGWPLKAPYSIFD